VAVGLLYGIFLLMLSLSEMPGLNSKVPFTCACRTLYGLLVLLPNLQGFSSFLKYPLFEGHSRIDDAFDFSNVIFMY
jgi:hypothetical protein